MKNEVKVVFAPKGTCRACHKKVVKVNSHFCSEYCMTGWATTIINVLDSGDILVGYEPSPAEGKLMERALRKKENRVLDAQKARK